MRSLSEIVQNDIRSRIHFLQPVLLNCNCPFHGVLYCH